MMMTISTPISAPIQVCESIPSSSSIDAAFDEIDLFMENLQNDVETMDRKTRRNDPLTVASVAYRLKKSARERGMDLLFRSASQIENSARKNRMGQLAAEIDLMRFQIELISQSTKQ